jgi:hypothetical protein
MVYVGLMKKIIIFFTLLLWPQGLLLATPLAELEATPSVMTEDDAKLLITEVSFKNSDADWVELYYQSPSGKPLNIKGVTFADDSVFKTVENFTIQSGQYFLLTFKSTQTDSTPYLYTDRSGLTGTTEQFIVYDKNGKVMDAVCWTSSSPTAAETADMQKLAEKEGWIAPAISSCINAEQIKKDVSIIRKGLTDTDSADDWLIASEPTPAAANVYEDQTQTTEEENDASQDETAAAEDATDDVNTDTPTDDESATADTSASETVTATAASKPGVDIKEANPAATAAKKASTKKSTTAKKTTKKTTTKKTAADYTNGDLSENVAVSEILPNPAGTDTKSEWIEIFNSGSDDVNLGNWTLDDDEGGSKPYVFSDQTIIKAQSALLIPITDSKISLSNTADMVRLFDFEGTSLSEISYKEAPEAESYALISILDESGKETTEWLWQKTPTPNETNPSYTEITATITQPPQKENPYSFQIADSKTQTHTILFDEETLPAALAIASLTKDSKIKLVVENADTDWRMIRYEILEPAPTSGGNDFFMPSIFGSIITAAGSAFYFLRRKIKFPSLFNLSGK